MPKLRFLGITLSLVSTLALAGVAMVAAFGQQPPVGACAPIVCANNRLGCPNCQQGYVGLCQYWNCNTCSDGTGGGTDICVTGCKCGGTPLGTSGCPPGCPPLGGGG